LPCVLSGTALRVPKKPGESCLKPAKNKSETHLLPKRTHRARPTLRWPPRSTGVAPSKAPSSRFRLARGLTPPSSGFRLARGPTPPSSGFSLARGPPPPSSGFRLARGPAPPSSGFRLARGLAPTSSGFRLAQGLTPPSSGFRVARGLTSASLETPSRAHLLPHAGTGI
jgi:hypothetical protein